MKTFQELLVKNGYNITIDGIIGPNTIKATEDFIFKQLDKRKWVRPINDFVWLRLDNTLTNTYDDVCVRFNGSHIDMIFPCSTTAGDYYIFNPITEGGVTGTAIATEQQVIKSHRFVTSANWASLLLGGPYFQEDKPVSFYRDGNKDRNIDRGTVYTRNIGINFHHGGAENIIYNWSAACMIAHPKDWYEAIKIFKNGDKIGRAHV